MRSLLALCVFVGMGGQSIAAPRVCVSCQRPAAIVKTYAAPVQQVVVPLQAPYFYQVGQQLQDKGQATYQMRLSDEYQELIELRGYFKRGQEQLEIQRLQALQAQPEGDVLTQDPEPVPGSTTATDPREYFPQVYPILHTRCASCHIGDGPGAQELLLDGSPQSMAVLQDPAWRGMILESVHNDRMPKKGAKLTPQEKYELAVELLQGIVPEPVPAEQPAPPAEPLPGISS